MRRLVALFLTAAFLLQATGSAATPSQGPWAAPSIGSELLASIMVAKANFASTFVGAALTGTMSRYSAMHDTQPDFSHVRRTRRVDLSAARTNNAVRGIPRVGTRVDMPGPLETPPPPNGSGQQAMSAALHLRAVAPLAVFPKRATRSTTAVRTQSVDSTVPSTTGVNRYWTYEEGAIPGVGKWMLNVATGNVMLSEDDIDVPERGIDLAFRRTFNQQSGHSYENADGSTMDNYGEFWTNTFDTHLGYDPVRNVISWYDIDGARYDYSWNGASWVAPAGQTAQLAPAAGGCGFWITKKSGTAYEFYAPDVSLVPNCTTLNSGTAALLGRLDTIYARNRNNYLHLQYSWSNGDASSGANLAQIIVQHSDGHALTMQFADFAGHRLLQSIQRPDGVTVDFGYNASAELMHVCDAGNGNVDNSPWSSFCNDQSHRHHQYWYGANHQLSWAGSANYSMDASGPNVPAAAIVAFGFDSSNRLTDLALIGTANFTPNDGTGVQLQPGSSGTGFTTLRSTGFTYLSSLTKVTDSDGHATNYAFDSLGRVVQRQAWQGSEYLVSSSAWDPQNNLIATTDARGNETDYAYDLQGNTIAVAAPAVATNVGTIRPTTLLSYDGFGNVIASCDPASVGATGFDWVGLPRDSHCAARTYKTSYTYNYGDTSEPNGMLTDTYTPLGYHHQILYNTGAQGGDYGLPSDVIGDSVGTQADGTTRQPHQSFTYDSHGNLVTYSAGTGAWTLAYDTVNRMISTTDADGVTNRTCYLDNGQVRATQTAAQYALDGTVCGPHSVSMTYDGDGNEIAEVHHFSDVAGTTTKFYDGLDRLVEVVQPRDTRVIAPSTVPVDFYGAAWMTRYAYDLTGGGTVAVGSVTGVHAYGNLYKTIEYNPISPDVTVAGGAGTLGWSDVRGTAFDPLDRATASYELAFGTAPKLTNTYDSPGDEGLLAHSDNALGGISTPTYDAAAKTTAIAFAGGGATTANRSSIYDPDGRVVSASSATFGAETFAYDADGRLTNHADPTGNGYVSPVTTAYTYYGDGQRKGLGVSSSSLTAPNLFAYSYRTDGLLQKESVAGPMSGSFAWTYTSAGREATQSDPFTGAVIPLYDRHGVATGQTRTLVARTTAYDSYGRIASLTLPEGFTYGAFAYDPEGETLSYLRSGGYGSDSLGTVAQTYSDRGELIGQAVSGTYYNWSYLAQAANGLMTCTGPPPATGPGSCTAEFDARTSQVLKNAFGTQTYDAAGRNTTLTKPTFDETNMMTRAYDTENHLVTQTYSGTNGTYECTQPCADPYAQYTGATPPASLPNGTGVNYAWGPSGHLLMQTPLPSTPGYGQYEHWDGDTLLMQQSLSPAGGTNPYTWVEVGKLATIGGGMMEVEDRDMSGMAVAGHDAMAFSAWQDARAYKPITGNKKPETFIPPGQQIGSNSGDTGSSGTSSGKPLSAGREDGYGDAYGNVFQGVRVYDPTMAQWTAPDAYAGDAHDPMSQKPFMWNNNNPLDFEDPSGYYTLENGSPEQKAAVRKAARDLDQRVVNSMSGLKKGSSEYKALDALHQDLQEGKGDWKISFGAGDTGELGKTDVSVSHINDEAQVKFTGVGGTSLDTSQMDGLADMEGTLATEGGIYEVASGRAGPALQSQAANAMFWDSGTLENGRRSDKSMDELTNRYFNIPICVPLDH